jgi:hypothetical protein
LHRPIKQFHRPQLKNVFQSTNGLHDAFHHIYYIIQSNNKFFNLQMDFTKHFTASVVVKSTKIDTSIFHTTFHHVCYSSLRLLSAKSPKLTIGVSIYKSTLIYTGLDQMLWYINFPVLILVLIFFTLNKTLSRWIIIMSLQRIMFCVKFIRETCYIVFSPSITI